MPRVAKPLTAAKVRTAKVGRYADGQTIGLYLLVRPGGKAWTYRYTSPTQKQDDAPTKGKLRDMSLGPVAVEDDRPGLTLAKARDAAADLRKLVLAGIDPQDKRAEDKAAAEAAGLASTTFQQAAKAFLVSREGTWKSAKHEAQCGSTLASVYPKLDTKPIGAVSARDVADALSNT